MRGSLVEELEYIGVSPTCHQILNRSYVPPPGTPPHTTEYLQHLKKAPNIQDLPSAYLATEEF